jgi:salicylate hydroxylase
MSWAASAALHLPDGAAARRRDAYLAQLPERVAWIHGHDVLSCTYSAPGMCSAR